MQELMSKNFIPVQIDISYYGMFQFQVPVLQSGKFGPYGDAGTFFNVIPRYRSIAEAEENKMRLQQDNAKNAGGPPVYGRHGNMEGMDEKQQSSGRRRRQSNVETATQQTQTCSCLEDGNNKVNRKISYDDIDGLMQERCNSIVLAMELRLSCINSWMCFVIFFVLTVIDWVMMRSDNANFYLLWFVNFCRK